jgi:hypothetical protein
MKCVSEREKKRRRDVVFTVAKVGGSRKVENP